MNPENELTISECFVDIQGEGINIGKTSIFIRFSKCNQNCSWCDTKDKIGQEKFSLKDIIEPINALKSKLPIVITGGEPMLYQNHVLDLIELYGDRQITIETNGSIRPKGHMVEKDVLWSVSPKLMSSGNNSPLLSLYHYFSLSGKLQMKFVIGNKEDYTQFLELLPDIPHKAKIILQPVTYDSDGGIGAYSNLLSFTVEDIMSDNCFTGRDIRILPQLHKIASSVKNIMG